jgi:TldD protein
MKRITRRSFIKAGAAMAASAAAIPTILSKGWYALADADSPGYFDREFGISEALARKILSEALAKGGDFADLFFEHTVSNYLILEDGKVNRAFCDVDLGVGIRTVKGDQVGYGFTQDLGEAAMRAAAATAATIASGAALGPTPAFALLKTRDYYPLERLLSSVPLASKIPLVQAANDRAFALSPLVAKVNVMFHDQQKRILILTSEGVKAEDLQPRSYLALTAVAEKDGRRERSGWNFGGRQGFSYYTPALVEELAATAVRRALILFEAVQPPAGEMPVVLGPGVSGVLLHEAIGHGMEADFNRKKTSTFSTMLGRKVAESFVTIVDDGTVPHLNGSINFDDEGTPGQKTVLVDKGILSSYMHDKISARFYGVKPTGNGRRESYQHYPIPRMRNTYMLAGPASVEDLARQAGRGIYVEDVSNGQVKIGEGDFAFYVSQGRMIENGKLGAPIKDVNIMGNGPKMLANITALADDFQFHLGGAGACGKGGQAAPVGFGQPSCLVKSLTVGGVRS